MRRAGDCHPQTASLADVLPSVQQVAEATPATRDRFVDVVRLFCLLVVITGHGTMLLVIVEPGRWRFGNALAGSPVLQALTWVLQVMPLFFFAGAAACVSSCRTSAARGVHRHARPKNRALTSRNRRYRAVFTLTVHG